MRFYGVCTDLATGRAVYRELRRGDGRDIDWIRASASIPVLSRPVRIGKRLLLDGGIADPIPLAFARFMGCKKNVVILTREAGFVLEKERMLPVLRLFLRRYPRVLKTLEERHIRYRRTLEKIREAEKEGEVFVIRPPRDLGISGMPRDPKELLRVYETGRDTARGQLEALKKFLYE